MKTFAALGFGALLFSCGGDSVVGVEGTWLAYPSEVSADAGTAWQAEDTEARSIGICRFEIDGAVLPGTLLRDGDGWSCENSFFDKAHVASEFEVLGADDSFAWVAASDGDLSEAPLIGGMSKKGDPLYVCRVQVGDAMIFGKTRPAQKTCLYPEDGVEKTQPNYWVLNRG